MVEQQSTSRRSVLLTGAAFAIAAVAFGAAFYFLDGMTVLADLMAGVNPFVTEEAVVRPSVQSPTELKLPDGMPERFALQLWQEQVDSQEMIGRLVDGDIVSMSISDVETSSVEASLSVTARMSDGARVNGVIGLRRFGERWYVAFASHERGRRIVASDDELPSADEVDVALLNTIVDEQRKSQQVFGEYVAGMVRAINIDEVRRGPSTVTIDATMNESHGKGFAQIVAIRHEIDGKTYWFLARFSKTGHDPANL